MRTLESSSRHASNTIEQKLGALVNSVRDDTSQYAFDLRDLDYHLFCLDQDLVDYRKAEMPEARASWARRVQVTVDKLTSFLVLVPGLVSSEIIELINTYIKAAQAEIGEEQ